MITHDTYQHVDISFVLLGINGVTEFLYSVYNKVIN